METGLVHFYIGDGKGKSTAAAGMALRMIGNGFRVLYTQFLKSSESAEVRMLRGFPDHLDFYSFNSQKKAVWNMNEEEKETLRSESLDGLQKITELLKRKNYQLVVLDELLNALRNGTIRASELEEFLIGREKPTEYILTGRIRDDALFQHADYITEMKKISHPYDRGIRAREGVEY